MTPEEKNDVDRMTEVQLLVKYGGNNMKALLNEAGLLAPKRGGRFICTQCGYLGSPRTQTGGSFLIEILLWCLMILPGLIYSCWRLTSKKKVCPKCGKPDGMIPVDSPVGKKLLAAA